MYVKSSMITFKQRKNNIFLKSMRKTCKVQNSAKCAKHEFSVSAVFTDLLSYIVYFLCTRFFAHEKKHVKSHAFLLFFCTRHLT